MRSLEWFCSKAQERRPGRETFSGSPDGGKLWRGKAQECGELEEASEGLLKAKSAERVAKP